MNKKDTLSKIRENLKSLMKFSQELKSFSNFDLTDGTKITSPDDTLQVGSEVFALDDQMNQTPVEDGEYVLTDGTTITIVNGAVSELTGGDEDPQDDTETPDDDTLAKQKMSDGVPDDQPAKAKGEATSDISSRISDLEKQIEDILNMLKSLSESQGSVNEQMMSRIHEFGKEPGAKAIKHGKREIAAYDAKKASSQEFRDQLKTYQDMLKSNK